MCVCISCRVNDKTPSSPIPSDGCGGGPVFHLRQEPPFLSARCGRVHLCPPTTDAPAVVCF